MNSILELCESLSERRVAPEVCLIEEGVPQGALFILVEGRVEIRKGDHVVDRVAVPGAIFGEVSLLLGQAPMATVKCLTPCTFRVAEDGHAFLRTQPEACWHVARVLAQRLNSLTHYLVDLKEQFGDRQDHLGMVDEVLESLLHHQRRSD